MTQNELADPSEFEIALMAIRTTPAKEKSDGIRIRGIPESKNDDARCRQEQDFNAVQKVLEHINVEAAISDVTRLGKYDTNKLEQFSKCQTHTKDARFSGQPANC